MKAARAADGGVDPVEAVAWLAVAVALLFQNPYGDFGPESDRFLLLQGLALALVALAAVAVRRDGSSLGDDPRGLLRSPWSLAALGFVASAVVSALFAIDRWRSFPGTPPRLAGLASDVALAAIFFVLSSRLARRAARERLEQAIALAGAAVIAYSAEQWAGFDPVLWSLDWQGRPVAAQGNPLYLAQALVWVAPLLAARAVALRREGSRRESVATAVLFAAAVALAARTGSVAALAGLAVATLLFMLVVAGRGGFALRLLARPVAVAVAAVALLAGLTLWAARNGGDMAGTAGQRALLWRAALARLGEAPPARLVAGFGQDSGSIVLAAVVPPELPERIWRPDLYQDRAHNAGLDALLAGGALRAAALAALFALAVAGAARRSLAAASPAEAAMAAGWLGAIVGHGVAISVGIATAATSLLFWLALAVQAGAATTPPRSERPAPPPERARRLQLALVLLVVVWSGWLPAQVGGAVGRERAVYFAATLAALLLAGAAAGPKRGRLVPFAVAGGFLAILAALLPGARFGLALATLLVFAAAAIVAFAGKGAFRAPSAPGWGALAVAAAGCAMIALAIGSGIRLKSGRAALAAGDAVAAEETLAAAAARTPFFEEIPVTLARARLRRADRATDSGARGRGFAEAEAALATGESYHPRIATFPLERGHLESRRGEATAEPTERRRYFERAVELFRRALALEPQASVAHRGLGAALLALGEVEEARRALAEGVRLAPRSVESRLLLARAELAAGDLERARSEVAQAAATDAARARSVLVGLARARPNDASAYRDLALLDLVEGRPDRARMALQQAVSVAEPEEMPLLVRMLALADGAS